MDGTIAWAIIWMPVWTGVALAGITIIILTWFVLHRLLRAALDATIAAIRDSPIRHARLERAYIAKHQRQNAGSNDARGRG